MGTKTTPKSPGREQMQRLHRIIRELKRGTYPTQGRLAEALGVSKRTIQRDMDCLRDGLELPVHFDAEHNGFFIDGDIAHMPSYLVEEGEVLALFVAERALAQYRGTAFEEPLKTAFERLAAAMTDLVQFSPSGLDAYLSFAHTGRAVQELEVFQTVMHALQEHRELYFRYKKMEARRAEKRHVQPLHMACINHQWYLFANDLKRGAVRTFVLGRILGRPEEGALFERPPGFSLKGLLANSFGVFQGDGDFRVKLDFDPFGAQLVREKRWHASQEIREKEDGGLVLSMRLGALEEVERWVLWFGQHVKVVEPSQLRLRVKKAAREMAKHYAEEHPWFYDLKDVVDPRHPQSFLELFIAMDRDHDHPGQLTLELPSGRN